MKRRDFLIGSGTIGGIVIPGLSWASVPCPPPIVAEGAGAAASTTCGASAGSLPVLKVKSAAPSGTYGWTFGQPFRQGDVPGGKAITTANGDLQASVRNLWPDGSVKFAVLSGVTSFTQNQAEAIDLLAGDSTAAGSSVAEPTDLDVTVTFSGGVSGTYPLRNALGVNKETWSSKSGAGRVRKILGPVMSEFHYYVPTTDQHVSVWFYVRRYSSGATEVETVVENGWLNLASPATKSYSTTVSVGGTVKYSGSLTHHHHARWSRVDWIGTDPQITPQHDSAYLISTKLVPNYGWRSPTAAAYASNWTTATNPPPLAAGYMPDDISGTGGADWIALMPKWDALYCTAADVKAYRASLGMAREQMRYGFHFRDEVTGRPADHRRYVTSGFSYLVQKAEANTCYPVDATGPHPPAWEIPHHGSTGYMAYIISGRWTMLEEIQMSAIYALCREGSRPAAGVIVPRSGVHTTRGGAWAWRSMGQAAGISPTEIVGDTAVQASLAACIDATSSYLKTTYVDVGGTSAATGFLGLYHENDNINADGYWWNRNWMQSFQILALAHISDLGIPNMTQSTLAAVRDHAFKAIIRMFVPGTNAQWNWRHSAQYDIPYQDASLTLLTTAQAYAIYTARFGTLADNAAALAHYDSNTTLESDTGQGYTMYKIAALAFAIDHGVTNAQSAYNQLATATNLPQEFPPNQSGDLWHDDPRWGIVPR